MNISQERREKYMDQGEEMIENRLYRIVKHETNVIE